MPKIKMNTTRELLLLLLLVSFPVARAQQARSGEDVLRAMHDRYANSWYRTLTFTQKSTTYNADGTTKVETWYEAADLPGKLRVDIGPPSNGNGFLMVDGTLTTFREGKETGHRPLMNMLLVLGFDVYRQPADTTIKVVKDEGYDLTRFHEEIWDGLPVYVIGAEKGDFSSKQFWVDKNRLLFVRLFEPTQADATKFREIRFEGYRKLGSGWVAAQVEVRVNDRKIFSEEYSEIKSNVELDPVTFDPKQFNSSHWEKP